MTSPPTLDRRALRRKPIVDGRELRDGPLARLRRRIESLRISRAEFEEVDLERRLRAPPRLTRPNIVAVIGARGGVGKTTATFLVGNLLASHPKLRTIAVDVNASFGTLSRLPMQGRALRPELLDDLDRIGTAAELRRYVSALPTGLHLLPAHPSHHTSSHYGDLIALISCFYDTVLLDLGPDVTRPLARLAASRADQIVLVTTPNRLTASVVLQALDDLPTDRTTVVINKAHPHPADEVCAVEECFRTRRPHGMVTVPYDRRLATMLDTGTYSLGALDTRARLPVKRLGLSVAEQLV